jgi:hypothetical protein
MALESSNIARPLPEPTQNNGLNGSANYIGKLDPQRLASFDPKVQSAIVQIHRRREYISLDDVLNEIKDWSAIEQLFYLEFLCQQQSGLIDQAVVCRPQYVVDVGIRKLQVDFRFSLPDPVLSILDPILFYVELDSFRWHGRRSPRHNFRDICGSLSWSYAVGI